MKDPYKGFLALDGSVLIALALGEKGVSDLEKSLLNEDSIGLTHEYALTELLYILCRKASKDVAIEKLNYLKWSGYITVVPTNELMESVAMLKCERSIALADCFTISLAQKFGGKAVFAKAEKELLKELRKQAFNVDIIFVLDKKYIRKGETTILNF